MCYVLIKISSLRRQLTAESQRFVIFRNGSPYQTSVGQRRVMVQQASVLSDSAIVRQRSVFEDQGTHFLMAVSKSMHGKDVVVFKLHA